MTFNLSWLQAVTFHPNLTGIVQVLKVPELLQWICHDLDLYSISSLRATCKLFWSRLANLASERMRRALTRVLDPQGTQHPSFIEDFASMIRSTGSVVGGSLSLWVLCPGEWLPGDIDVITDSQHGPAVIDFIQAAGYIVDADRTVGTEDFYPGRIGLTYAENSFDHVRFEYQHFTKAGSLGIDLCIVLAKSVAIPSNFILTYHSTAVMNFWDGRYLYCVWPELTFKGLLMRNEYTPTVRIEEAIKKYKIRGFTDKYSESQGLRYIQDDFPVAKNKRLTVGMIPKPLWREPLTLSSASDLEVGMQSLSLKF